MKRALLVTLFAACGDDPSPRSQLPGTIWLVEELPVPMLVHVAAGARTPIAAGVYPSAHALRDGRLVAIASRGDGSPDAEQLALVSGAGRVERVGPAGAQVRDPAVDPHGRSIVIAANLDGHSDLYRVSLAGPVSRLTDDAQGNYHPALIGESIVYVSSRDGDSEIYRGAQRLTAFHRDDWEPTPAPDGKTIAFLSDREGAAHIYLMNADGTNLRRLAAHRGEESQPTWSRDGTQLAYVVDGQVWIRDLSTGRDRQVTPAGVRELEPSFSPDGRWLAVARMRGETSDVWAIRLDGGDAVLVAQNARLPRWH